MRTLRYTCITALRDAGCAREQVRSITGYTIASIDKVLDRYTKLTAQAGSALAKRFGPRESLADWLSLDVRQTSIENGRDAGRKALQRTKHNHDKTLACLHFVAGAPGRTRTNTSVRKPDFER